MEKKRRKISLISKLNYVRLFYRSVLFLGVVGFYILTRVKNVPFFDFSRPYMYIVVGFITLSFVGEMIERLLPSKTSSMGSQKQFRKNYVSTGEETPELQSWKATLLVFSSWVILNGIIATLYFLNIFDAGIMVSIALLYSICDMICILYFCPFQTWMMHNRCCGTCRIYNWDFAMMFTPLIFIVVVKDSSGYQVNPFAIILVVMSWILLAKWEITYRLYPERFSDKTNASLRCENCHEKLCAHKKQLQKLIKKSRELLLKRLGKEKPSEEDK